MIHLILLLGLMSGQGAVKLAHDLPGTWEQMRSTCRKVAHIPRQGRYGGDCVTDDGFRFFAWNDDDKFWFFLGYPPNGLDVSWPLVTRECHDWMTAEYKAGTAFCSPYEAKVPIPPELATTR